MSFWMTRFNLWPTYGGNFVELKTLPVAPGGVRAEGSIQAVAEKLPEWEPEDPLLVKLKDVI